MSDDSNDSKMDERLRTIVNHLPGMAYRCRNDKNWTMDFVSDGALKLTGYRPEELQNSAVVSFASIIHPDDRDMVWDKVQAANEARIPFQMKYRILTKEGTYKWVGEEGQLADLSNKLSVLEGYISDISEEMKVGIALRRNEEKYKSLTEASSDMVWTVGPEAEFESPQTSWGDFTGQSWEKYKGRGWLDAIHPDDLDSVAKQMRDGLKKKVPCSIMGRVFCAETGAYHHSESRAVPILRGDGSGLIREWVGTTKDIHLRQVALDKLKESEERFKLAFMASNTCAIR